MGWEFYKQFYWLTMWGSFLVLLSMIIKLISTIKVRRTMIYSDWSLHRRWFILHKVLLFTTLPVITVIVIQYWSFIYDPSTETLTDISGCHTINTHGITFV